MRSTRRVLLATTLLALAPGLASAQEMKAEVLHWWTSGGESAAVKVFADAFEQSGGTWVDTAIAGGETARAAGLNRIVGGNPPTVMQFNTGKQFDEIVANELVAPLDDVPGVDKWPDLLPPAIVEAVSRDGTFYAVPVNIHGQNWLFYNSKLFADAGVQPPATFEDLIAAGPKLKEKGLIPLAHGGQSWQDQILFDSVLLAEAGPEIFARVYGENDVDAAQSDGFRKAADTFGTMRELIDPGSPGRNWNDATSMVITGKAGAQIMGDWAKGEFIAAGLTPGKEYGCTVMPGGYVMGGDVFVFPVVDEAQHPAQVRMAELMMSPEVQIEFNKKKGSVPVRLDIDVSSMDECAQKGMAELRDPKKQIPSINFISSPDLVGATRDVITQFWNTPGMTTDQFVEKFVGALKAAS